MSELIAPAADVRLYDAGAEGYVSDPGFCAYDRPALSLPYNDVTYVDAPTSDYDVPSIVRLPDFGCVMLNPLPEWQDGELDNWTLLEGDTLFFEEQWPWGALGTELAQVISYLGMDGITTGRARTTFNLPENPMFGMFIAHESPTRDATAPAYLRLKFGNLQWMIHWEQTEGLYLSKWNGSAYRRVLELSPPEEPNGPSGFVDGMTFIPLRVLCLDGKVGVMTEPAQGASALVEPRYQVYEPAVEQSVAEGPLELEAYGIGVSFTLQPVKPPDEGEFTCAPIPFFEPRPKGSYFPNNNTEEDYHYFNPPGIRDDELEPVSLTWDVREDGTKFVYTAKLRRVPQPTTGAPWDFYASPRLYAVEYEYDVVTAAGSGNYTSLTDTEHVSSVDVNLPRERDGGTADITVDLDPHTAFSGEYRWRYMLIRLGYKTASGITLYDTFAGYISRLNLRQHTGWETAIDIQLQLIDASWAAKRVSIDEGWPPLDGLLAANALAYCAARVGIPPARQDWSEVPAIHLSAGPADSPIWWRNAELPLGMTAWEAMSKVAAWVGCDLWVAGDGVWTAAPVTFTTGTSHSLEMAGAGGSGPADTTALIMSLDHEAATLEAATATIASGESNGGRAVAAWLIDFDRERDTTTTPFAGRRMWQRTEGERYNSVSAANHEAQAMYDSIERGGYRVSTRGRGRPQVRRRDTAFIANAEAGGVNPSAEHLIRSVRHSWRGVVMDTFTDMLLVRL